MPVELAACTGHFSHRPYLGDLPGDGYRDGASDLDNASLITDHLYRPCAAGNEWERCAHCELYCAAHAGIL